MILSSTMILGLIIFALGYSIQDKQEFHYHKSWITKFTTKWISKIKNEKRREFWIRFFSPTRVSSLNKYKLDDKGELIPVLKKNWYYKLAGIDYKERFFLSSNWLVGLVDIYHMCTNVQVLGIAIMTGQYWILLAFPILFHTLFHFILNTKTIR